MSVNQALSTALAGVNATQQALSVIAGNVANANTPGYVEQSVKQIETVVPGQVGAGIDVTGIDRNLNTLLQSQLWTETSGSAYADTTCAALSATPASLWHARFPELIRRDLQ